MPKQIVVQPNGMLALWSTVVDDFVCFDATEEEIADELSDGLIRIWRQRVKDVLAELRKGGKPYRDFTRSFDECVSTIREIHGGDTESLRMMGLAPPKSDKC